MNYMWDHLVEATKLRLVQWERTSSPPLIWSDKGDPNFFAWGDEKVLYTYRAHLENGVTIEVGPVRAETRSVGLFMKQVYAVFRLRIITNGAVQDIETSEFREAHLVHCWIENTRRDTDTVSSLMTELGALLHPRSVQSN